MHTDICVYTSHIYIQIYMYTYCTFIYKYICIHVYYLCIYVHIYIYSTDINNATFVPCEKHFYDVSAAN